jgi:hypothetical protein
MITENEIMYDALYEMLETPLNKELEDVMQFFQDEFDVQPQDAVALMDRWLDKRKYGKKSIVKIIHPKNS